MRSLAYFIGTFVVALMLGIGSAWYMIERGSPLTTTKVGPWDGWVSEGNPNADPYTKAHVARSGRLPLTSTVARYFVARTDSAGHTLTSACAIFDRRAAAQRALVVACRLRRAWRADREPDGALQLQQRGGCCVTPTAATASTCRRKARPENWLPSGTAEQNLVLMLRVYSPRETDASGIGLVPGERLPKIERTVMRVRIPGLYIVLGLVLAGLIHIVAVLTLPMLAPQNAHARLVRRSGRQYR